MTTPGKQVIYVDVDDEITAIIDKMNATDARVIALVLPKRATVLQSIVNMKLLKHRAEGAKKHLVLITSETGLMPLAGMAGIHVAQTLQSKPEIPGVPQQDSLDDSDEAVALAGEQDTDGDFNAQDNGAKSVGALASQRAAGGASIAAADNDVIELDEKNDGSLRDKNGKSNVADDAKAAKPSKDKKLNVPNFLRFRKRLIFGILGVFVLIGLWYVAYFVMPKASIVIKTDSSDVEAALDLTLDTGANTVDDEKLVVPAQTQQQQKTNTQQVAATGTQNKGERASGTVTIINCSADGSPVTIPAGTGVSTNGLTFITQKTLQLQTSTPGCKAFGGFTSGTVDVVAEKGGAQYNVGPSTFTTAGIGSVQVSSSEAMTGGTDNNVKVVQQSDVDGAKQKISTAQGADAIKRQLQQNLEHDGLYAVLASFNAGTPNVTTSVNVGDEAENVTVTETIGYTMYGVKKDDLHKLVEAFVSKKIDTKKQSMQDDGLSGARFTVPSPGSGAQLKVSMVSTATAGPHLDVEALKKQIVGQKSGNVKDTIKENPGVVDAEVKYSPFWVTKAPKAEKITVTFEKGTTKSSNNDK